MKGTDILFLFDFFTWPKEFIFLFGGVGGGDIRLLLTLLFTNVDS